MNDVTKSMESQISNQYTDFSSGHGNVSLVKSLILGLIISVAVLAAAYAANTYYPPVYEIYYQRGVIPYIITVLFGFALAVLIFKALWLRNEKKVYDKPYVTAFSMDFNPIGDKTTEIKQRGQEVPVEDAERFILSSRLYKALSRYKKTRSVSAVDEILRASSEVDRDLVETSYSLTTFIIWVIPILGFLGTVIGVGSAIGGFNNVIDAAGSGGFSAVRENIGVVTGNLALAFDTTLLALIYAALIMLVSSLGKKRDEDFLSGVDRFCHENVMAKLEEMAPETPGMPGPVDVGDIEQALRQMAMIMERIDGKLENLGQGGAPEGLMPVLEKIARGLELNQEVIQFGQKLDQLVDANLQMISEVPKAVEGLNEQMERLGGLFARIYGKQY